MPRIDPAQLLNCLQVLLSPTGGILSEEEVHRLASLMTKFSKKLVSKCVYVLILKNTEKHLLNLFMGCGGWTLVQLWLHDAMYSSNWVLVKELLELLILTPVDVERLKSNNIPKLVKSLSKREDLEGVSKLASQLVQQWLKIVKDETQSEQQRLNQANAATSSTAASHVEGDSNVTVASEQVAINDVEPEGISTKSFYKLSLKGSKNALNRSDSEVADNVTSGNQDEAIDDEEKDKLNDDKKKSHDKSKHKSSSSSKSSKSHHKEKHGSSSSSTTGVGRSKDKDKSKDKDRHHSSSRDKHKHRSNSSGASSTSSSSSKGSSKTSNSSTSKKDKEKHESKDSKEKQNEKDQDTLHQLLPQSIHKLPKIPKKSADNKNKEPTTDTQKGTISIEIRKAAEERPKTVKVYKSKMRSTGLEEEAKPAPPRTSKKPGGPPIPIPPLPATATVVAPVKRSSPIRDVAGIPPEKKTKMDIPVVERPGAIKLIPPKPKPAVLQESDMFMDALTAATTKKEPKKRKRRASASKDSGSSPPHSPTSTAAPSATSPIGIKNIVPPKFYQDTLQTDDSKSHMEIENTAADKENGSNRLDTDAAQELGRSTTPIEDNNEENSPSEVQLNANGLKSVLVYTRRKGPKKSIKWKADSELVDVRYFELDESERVNVTRAFGDMAKMDVRGEREALQLSRKLQNDDVMEAQIVWKVPTEIDLPTPLVVPGSKSFERDIQFAREKTVLQALYFNKRMVPDSPGEPEPETYQIKDPIPIPVDDAENPDHDFRKTPWPEPKGSPPRPPVQNNPPIMFHNPPQPNFQSVPVQPPSNFSTLPELLKPNLGPPPPSMQFPNPQQPYVPHQQNILNPDWNARNMVPTMSLMPPNIPNMQNMPPPEHINQVPPMFMQPPEQFNPNMNMNMNEPNHRFPGPYNQQGPPPGMFPPNNFNHHPNRGGHGRGRGNNSYGGGFHRGGGGGGGGGGWMRMNGPPQKSWHKNPRGHHRRGGGSGGNYDNRGYTGNADMY